MPPAAAGLSVLVPAAIGGFERVLLREGHPAHSQINHHRSQAQPTLTALTFSSTSCPPARAPPIQDNGQGVQEVHSRSMTSACAKSARNACAWTANVLHIETPQRCCYQMAAVVPVAIQLCQLSLSGGQCISCLLLKVAFALLSAQFARTRPHQIAPAHTATGRSRNGPSGCARSCALVVNNFK